MDYIVFDLEWNQRIDMDSGSECEADLPFEIIEIGAVKLGPDMQLKGMFSQLIKPKVYTRLHQVTRDLLGITEADLEKGSDFATVYREFIEFCGDDYIFCTWGDSDIFELLDNVSFFGVESPFDCPVLYLDIQRIYNRHYNQGKNRAKLSSVIKELGIRVNSDFHRAINDAKYTAEVMKHMDMKKYKKELSIDTYFVPAAKEDEIFLKGDGYTRYLSRCFSDRNELMADKEVTSLRCPICGRNCKREFPWFLSAGKVSYFVLGNCQIHGMVRGKIKTKSGPDDTYFALKKITLATPEDVREINEKKIVKMEHQKRKRHRRQISK
ncbi:MAG: exonuclease domain-containing protein [Lachnospiraceae bacterium]